jgi:hypothetical protein
VNGSTAGPILASLMAAIGVARTQPRLAAIAHEVRERDDLYALPPPAQLHAATLGWDAAAVDLLWAKLLVEYGIHWSEHREFKDVPRYVDAILELEPTYAPMYRFVDTMLAYRPLQGTEDDVRLARGYLERGTRVRADDARIWMQYGQFLAFIGPSFLHDAREKDDWRKVGAEAIGHAAELGADAGRAVAAASMLTRAGATQAAIGYLEHAYAFTEHPSMTEIHEAIGRKLVELEAGARLSSADAAARAIDARWRREIPFLSRDRYLLLGPMTEPARCAGIAGSDDPECARTWDALIGDSAQP